MISRHNNNPLRQFWKQRVAQVAILLFGEGGDAASSVFVGQRFYLCLTDGPHSAASQADIECLPYEDRDRVMLCGDVGEGEGDGLGQRFGVGADLQPDAAA